MSFHSMSTRATAARVILVLVLTLAGHRASTAQTCFRGRPLPTCKSFLITEFGARLNFTRDSAGSGLANQLTVPITGGLMVNLRPEVALGAVIGLDPDVEYSDWFFAAGPRLRYWAGDVGLDGTATVAVGDGQIRNLTLTGGMMIGDYFGMDAGIVFDRVKDYSNRPGTRPFVGLRLGSYPGLVGWGVTVGAYMFLAVALSNYD